MSDFAKIKIPITRYEPNIELFTDEGVESPDEIEGANFNDGECIVYFSNLRKEKRKYAEIQKCFDGGNDNISIGAYYLECLEKLSSLIGEMCAKIVVMDAQNEILEHKRKTTIEKQKGILCKNLNDLCMLAESHAKLISEITKNPQKHFLFEMILRHEGSMGGQVHYGVWPALRNGELILMDVYTVTTSTSLIYLDFAFAFQGKIKIKTCANCGKFFIPASRSDEIYCDNIYRNNKTCKQIGYEMKVASDDVLRTYRTIYKTQNARKHRNQKNILDINTRFDRWSEYAKKQLELCQRGDIGLDELKSRISSKEWMSSEEV